MSKVGIANLAGARRNRAVAFCQMKDTLELPCSVSESEHLRLSVVIGGQYEKCLANLHILRFFISRR
jgi:hypothetical protein